MPSQKLDNDSRSCCQFKTFRITWYPFLTITTSFNIAGCHQHPICSFCSMSAHSAYLSLPRLQHRPVTSSGSRSQELLATNRRRYLRLSASPFSYSPPFFYVTNPDPSLCACACGTLATDCTRHDDRTNLWTDKS